METVYEYQSGDNWYADSVIEMVEDEFAGDPEARMREYAKQSDRLLSLHEQYSSHADGPTILQAAYVLAFNATTIADDLADMARG